MLDLLKKIEQTYGAKQAWQVRQAYEYALKAHTGQQRKSGEPFIVHPVETARILFEMEMDVESLIAALLHDVVEDTRADIADILE